MGKRGPQPLSDDVLGTRKSTVPRARELRKEKAIPVSGGAPIKPAWMTAREGQIWDAIAPRLMEMGIMSEADGQALGRYCNVVSDWIEVTEKLRSMPALVKQAKNDTPYLNPYIRLKAELARELQALEDRFGLTPSARMSLNVTAMYRPGYKAASGASNDTPKNPTSTAPIGGERFFRGG